MVCIGAVRTRGGILVNVLQIQGDPTSDNQVALVKVLCFKPHSTGKVLFSLSDCSLSCSTSRNSVALFRQPLRVFWHL